MTTTWTANVISAMGSRWSRPLALVLLRRSQHALFAVIMVVGLADAWTEPHRWVLLVVTGSVAAWYLAGMMMARRGRNRRWAVGWLLVLTAGCAGLSAVSASFVWLAFPLSLLYTQMFALALSVPAVALITAGAIVVIAVDRGRVDAAAVVGPLVGTAVAVVFTVVYRDLTEQVRERAALINQLTATRDELAASQRRAGMLAERERLAREIHDTITQSLTSIVLILRTARDADPIRKTTPHDQLDAAIDAARVALNDTRRLVHDLTPAELTGQSLPAALGRIVADQPGLTARLHIEGDPGPVPTPVAVTLLRGAQEALANVRTHARARRAEVTLTFMPDAVSLDVFDDGIGFDPSQPMGPSTGTGLGLAGMRARAAEVGGSVEIDSAPGRGTAINLTVPRRKLAHD